MYRKLLPILSLFLILFSSCQNTKDKPGGNVSGTDTLVASQLTYPIMDMPCHEAHPDSILLHIAFLGDAEPKPLPEFPNMDAAVEQINQMHSTNPIDFVIGVGDIAHKGTEVQYEAASLVLQKLIPPLYPIMGNEEHGSTVEQYLHYAKQWNQTINSSSYVLKHEKLAFVFASPDFSRDFENEGVEVMHNTILALNELPFILIVHGAQAGVYPENAEKGIKNPLFVEKIIGQRNLLAVISGDLHMDMDRVVHSKQIDGVHYLHIPALERTKIPDETRHIPMIRTMQIATNGDIRMDTYAVGDSMPRAEHTYVFRAKLR